MGMTKELAQFVAGARYAELPEQAVLATKKGLLDWIAVTLAAAKEPVSENIRRYTADVGAIPEATVLGGKDKVSAAYAALANGAMSHALDYDDVIHLPPYWMGHPSVAILPAVLAVAESKNCSGQDLILSYAIGIEVYVKTFLCCGDSPYKNGWHNTSYIGTMAASAAASKLLGADEGQLRHAFGIAASLASGIRQNFGTMTKPLHAGFAARAGVEAAYLAAAGMTADENIYEAKLGFRNVFTADHQNEPDMVFYGEEKVTPQEFAKRLGNPWNIADPGMSFKLCPSCRATHFGMEAGLRFRKERPDAVSHISAVTCRVPDHMESVLTYHMPDKGLEGKFSLEYVLARTLLDGLPGIHDFTDERVREENVRALIKKIEWVSFHPEEGSFGIPEYDIETDDGKHFTAAVEFPRGEPENPVDDEVLTQKYEDCVRGVLDAEKTKAVKDAVSALDQKTFVRELTALLGA